jgi:hypothetical protein
MDLSLKVRKKSKVFKFNALEPFLTDISRKDSFVKSERTTTREKITKGQQRGIPAKKNPGERDMSTIPRDYLDPVKPRSQRQRNEKGAGI